MRLTVVIPCRNEKPYIAECVNALYACELPEHITMSVVVVDGMSNDGTREVVEQLKERYTSLFLCDNPQQLTPFAFNLGIHYHENPDYIQIVGARHILSSNYLKRCLELLVNQTEIWCVGGRIDNVYVNETGEIIAKAMSTSFGMGLGNFRSLSQSGFTDTVTSPMYPAYVFEKIGYFDEDLVRNQDDEFNFRVTQAGGKIYYAHDISLKYYVRGNYNQLWRQFFQYGYWKVFVNKKHRAVTTFRQLVPPLFCLFLLILPVFILLHSITAILGSGILGLYLLLSFVTAFKNGSGLKQQLILVGIFPLLHISYGTGYLNGILRFFILGLPPTDKRAKLSR